MERWICVTVSRQEVTNRLTSGDTTTHCPMAGPTSPRERQMLKARGDHSCCDRCAGATGMADAARVARRRLLKDAVFGYTAGLASEPPASLGAASAGTAAHPGTPGAAGGAQDGGTGGGHPGGPPSGFPDANVLPRAVTGTVLDVSPHVLVIGDLAGGPYSEQRFTLTAEAATWRG